MPSRISFPSPRRARRGAAAFWAALTVLAALLTAGSALACGVVARRAPRPLVLPARLDLADAGDPALRITFLGHASFLIETPERVTAVTDYNGIIVPDAPPDLVTMNHAHSTHYTDHPDPRIPNVLRGWREDGGQQRLDVTVRDLHVWNLPTTTRTWSGGTDLYGNSIFVFESAGLCVAHLGHLHHTLTPDDVATLGPIDVVMAPVDGVWTMDQADMAQVLDQLHPRIAIPMHYYSDDVADRFASLVRDRFTVRRLPTPTVTLSRATLPATPELLVVPAEHRY